MSDDFEGSIFGAIASGVREGSWYLSSKLDPRWNCSGEGIVSSWGYVPDAEAAIARLTKKYGKPPKDLTLSAKKD